MLKQRLYLFKLLLEVPNLRKSSTNIQESHLEPQNTLKEISVAYWSCK